MHGYIATTAARFPCPAMHNRRSYRSLAGRRVVLASSGEAPELPFMHAGHPLPAVLGQWADPLVAGSGGVTQGIHVRAILVDPCAHLISSADGPVAGDEDIDVARRALEQPQRGEVVLDRVGGAVQVEPLRPASARGAFRLWFATARRDRSTCRKLAASSMGEHPGWRALGNRFSLRVPGSAPVPVLADDDVQHLGGLGLVAADGFQLGC
jgi:hypothetical protein